MRTYGTTGSPSTSSNRMRLIDPLPSLSTMLTWEGPLLPGAWIRGPPTEVLRETESELGGSGGPVDRGWADHRGLGRLREVLRHQQLSALP